VGGGGGGEFFVMGEKGTSVHGDRRALRARPPPDMAQRVRPTRSTDHLRHNARVERARHSAWNVRATKARRRRPQGRPPNTCLQAHRACMSQFSGRNIALTIVDEGDGVLIAQQRPPPPPPRARPLQGTSSIIACETSSRAATTAFESAREHWPARARDRRESLEPRRD